MNADPSAFAYARRMLDKGYGYQNACRIAGVNEADLRSLLGTVRQRPSPAPWSPPRVRPDQTPAHTRAQASIAVSGPSREIIHRVATKYGMTTADLIGPARSRWFAYARQEAMYRIRQERGLSLPQIGAILGGRDHTTVLHGIRCHADRAAWADVLMVFASFDDQLELFAWAA